MFAGAKVASSPADQSRDDLPHTVCDISS